MNIAFPLKINEHGLVALTPYDDHVRQMIEQVLMTEPGERVNRPTFGVALQQYVFAGLTSELLTAAQAGIQSALQQWLGDVILVEAVKVTGKETTLNVKIQYVVLRTNQRQVHRFLRGDQQI